MRKEDCSLDGRLVRIHMVDKGTLLCRVVSAYGTGIYLTCNGEVVDAMEDHRVFGDFFIPYAFIAMIRLLPDKEKHEESKSE